MIRKLNRFIDANGWIALLEYVLSLPASKVRNWLFARQFGVRRIRIESGSFIRGHRHIRLGENFQCGKGAWIEAVTRHGTQTFQPTILIGNNVAFSNWVHVAATNHVEIGDGVLFGSKVIVTDHNHGIYAGPQGTSPAIPPLERPLTADARTIIGKNVWLGDGVVVTAGATIGEGAVIAANSVVIGEVPARTIAAGSPAKVVRRYDLAAKEWKRV